MEHRREPAAAAAARRSFDTEQRAQIRPLGGEPGSPVATSAVGPRFLQEEDGGRSVNPEVSFSSSRLVSQFAEFVPFFPARFFPGVLLDRGQTFTGGERTGTRRGAAQLVI